MKRPEDTGYRLFITGGLIVLGTGFIIMGVMRGEMQIVFQKAINICLECIGIG